MNRKLLPLFSKKNASFVVNGCFSPVVRTSYNKTKNGDIMCMLEKKCLYGDENRCKFSTTTITTTTTIAVNSITSKSIQLKIKYFTLLMRYCNDF